MIITQYLAPAEQADTLHGGLQNCRRTSQLIDKWTNDWIATAALVCHTAPRSRMQSVFSTSPLLRRFVVHVSPQRLAFDLRLVQCMCELWWTKWQCGNSYPRTSAFSRQYHYTHTLTHLTVSLNWHFAADTYRSLVLLHTLYRLINWCYKQVDGLCEF